MKEIITLDDLEGISRMLGVVEFNNQKAFRNDSNYKCLLIQRIKEYLFDKRDYDYQKCFEKAADCLKMEMYSGAKMYLENGFIKAYNNLEQIMKIKPLAKEIYEKNEMNPEESFNCSLKLAGKLSSIEF
ncbi:MAG: hypothetical protein WC376_04910 [Candidatus Nanoarchaeia archaeon]|jgi:hypothetical protein